MLSQILFAARRKSEYGEQYPNNRRNKRGDTGLARRQAVDISRYTDQDKTIPQVMETEGIMIYLVGGIMIANPSIIYSFRRSIDSRTQYRATQSANHELRISSII